MKPKYLNRVPQGTARTLRDKRSLALLGLFTLMYPVMLGYLLNQWIDRATRPNAKASNWP
jgi:sodium transport system permease protein